MENLFKSSKNIFKKFSENYYKSKISVFFEKKKKEKRRGGSK